eukprot:1408580-Prymnesium_polylepis.1
MPLSSRSKQLSNVLDPARFSLWDRRADRPGVQPCSVRGAGERRDESSACYCFRNGVLGG